MLCRHMRTTLPTNDQLLQPQIVPSDTVCQNIEKRRLSNKANDDKHATSQTHTKLEVGDQVYAKPPPQSHGRPWAYGNIVRKNGSRSYVHIRRNIITYRSYLVHTLLWHVIIYSLELGQKINTHGSRRRAHHFFLPHQLFFFKNII